MYSGELSFISIDAELANLMADVEAYLAANGVEALAPEPPAPAVEPPTTAEAPAPEAASGETASGDAPTEAPVEDFVAADFGPDFALDTSLLSVGQSLAGTEYVFIF